jgi:hypothetical protein
MLRFLKGLMKRDEPPGALEIGEIPAWIDGEERQVKDALAARVRGHRAAMLDARREMEGVLSGFERDSQDEVSRTKLAGVTEHSLPLFLRAMGTSLSHDLPDEPEAFYTAAGEILKGCLSAFRGQGRYLASRFPEEMKMLRGGVDTIGRELNSLTPEITRARERLRGLAELRGSHAAYMDATRRATLVWEQIRSLEEEVGASRLSLEGVTRALAELEKGEDWLMYQADLARVRSLEEDRDEASRLFRAVAGTATHLSRKGEKIAARKKDRVAARILHDAVTLLEGDLPIDRDAAERVLPPAEGALTAMVASGDLGLKNREESELLRVPGQLFREITGISGRFQEVAGGISSARDDILSRPAFIKNRDLMAERGNLERRITLAGGRMDSAKREVAELEDQARIQLDDVRQKIGGLSAKTLQVRDPEVS